MLTSLNFRLLLILDARGYLVDSLQNFERPDIDELELVITFKDCKMRRHGDLCKLFDICVIYRVLGHIL